MGLRAYFYGVASGIAFSGGVALWWYYDDILAEKPFKAGDTVYGRVADKQDVIDGDTIALTLRSGTVHKIRLWGIDAFESKQRCTLKGERVPCGEMALNLLVGSIARQDGALSCTVRGYDRYGRMLAECFSGAVNVGRILVQEGLAFAYNGTPSYAEEEARAKAAGAGMWAGDFITPKEWRAACGPGTKVAERPEFCRI